MLPNLQIDWLAVGAATLLNVVLGGLWYGPLFGKRWLALMGKTQEEVAAQAGSMGKVYGITIVLALLASIGLSDVIALAGPVTVPEGALLGLAVAVAFVVATNANTVLFEGRKPEVYGLYMAYQVVWFVLAGAMFAGWP